MIYRYNRHSYELLEGSYIAYMQSFAQVINDGSKSNLLTNKLDCLLSRNN